MKRSAKWFWIAWGAAFLAAVVTCNCCAATTGSAGDPRSVVSTLTLAADNSKSYPEAVTQQTSGSKSARISDTSNAPGSPLVEWISGPPKSSARPNGKWVTGYYTNWQEGLYPINRIDFTALTHIVLVHWLTNANGTLQSSGWDTAASKVTQLAHAAGVKVIMMLGGSDDSNFASAASSTNQTTLVNSILSKVSSLGLDGVDLDWEVKPDNADFIALASTLRSAQLSLIITVPIDASIGGSDILAAGLAPYCDQLNMMTYGGGATGFGRVSWYFSALGGDASNHPASINLFVSNWLRAGVPAAKIGVGVGFYSRGWTAPVTGALQSIGGATVPIGELPYGASVANGGGVLSWFYNQPGSNYVYDSGLAEQPSISIPGGMTPPGWTGAPITWVTYEDEASIAAKAAYVKANNLGGSIIWTLEQGATDPATGRNPLLDAVKLGILNTGPAPMPLLSSTTATVAGATNIAVTGLPSVLTQIGVVWRGGGTSFDENVYRDLSYGRPSEYYIEGSKKGSTWTALAHVTGNTYRTRQFIFDISGTGYTQIRMRVASIVGTYAGRVTLDVHNASNDSADTWLLLGDSVTSNCWDVVPGNGVDAFGRGVHTERPQQYPMAADGGSPSLLSGSLLSTVQYGMPVIRRWLKDFPGKYVGLSYGTNDANGNVPAGTYYANMRALVQEVIAAGKTPVVPTIVASPSANVQANAPGMNASLATLQRKYPSIIKGPDLWNLFQGHAVSDGWFLDSLHPSLTTGCSALQDAWIKAMVAAVYPQ